MHNNRYVIGGVSSSADSFVVKGSSKSEVKIG